MEALVELELVALDDVIRDVVVDVELELDEVEEVVDVDVDVRVVPVEPGTGTPA